MYVYTKQWLHLISGCIFWLPLLSACGGFVAFMWGVRYARKSEKKTILLNVSPHEPQETLSVDGANTVISEGLISL